MGWTFQDKTLLHQELGLVFVLVTPSLNEVFVADPVAAHTVLSKRKEFIKPAVMYEQMDVFGRSLNTVEGDDWQRHRRLTAPSFNEKISSSVWTEARRQCRDMLQSWIEEGSGGTRETVSDTATLALHVLSSAGFGISYSFREGVRKLSLGHQMTYHDALSLILRNIIILAIFPKRHLTSSIFPKKLHKLGQATEEFKAYMTEMLDNERVMSSKREPGTENLLSALVRASDEAKPVSDKESSNLRLSDDEIFGNIFIYNLAGHETTANTVATAIVLLAAHPECQEWLAEEIIYSFDKIGSSLEQEYDVIFSKLKRCLAVMYETLRLYGSIVFIPKTTGQRAEMLTTGGTQYLIPPGTFVNINSQALHSNPRFWGSDALIWRPSRWLTPVSSIQSTLDTETLVDPIKGTFIPWADGPRNCPGQKFAQVEFVAVMATLFRNHRVKPVLHGGESIDEGKTRLVQIVEDSAISAITLQMQNPRSIPLMWQETT